MTTIITWLSTHRPFQRNEEIERKKFHRRKKKISISSRQAGRQSDVPVCISSPVLTLFLVCGEFDICLQSFRHKKVLLIKGAPGEGTVLRQQWENNLKHHFFQKKLALASVMKTHSFITNGVYRSYNWRIYELLARQLLIRLK